MAISSADIAALPAYTNAELLTLYKWALANGAAGTTRTISGRVTVFPSTSDLLKAIGWLEDRIEAAANLTGGIALVRFGQPQ